MALKPKQLRPDEVKIGHWYTFCCELDRERIDDEETLYYVISDGEPRFKFYATEEDLIAAESDDS